MLYYDVICVNGIFFSCLNDLIQIANEIFTFVCIFD